MNVARAGHAMIAMPAATGFGDVVLVAGGAAGSSGSGTPYASTELYFSQPRSGQPGNNWVLLDGRGDLNTPRTGAGIAYLPPAPNRPPVPIIIAGNKNPAGTRETGVLKDVEYFTYDGVTTGTWAPLAGADMIQGRYRFGVASLPPYSNVVACGGSLQTSFLRDCEVFRVTAILPALTYAWEAGSVADLPDSNSNFGMSSIKFP